MTMTSGQPAAPRPARTVELVLAHTHLRLGSLALARVELETMAGMGLLDTGGIVDLAEVRWRTGDLLGAGEAASAALRDDPEHPIALVIAAEAASALGRPTEARRLADQAVRASRGSLDAIFGGMPRSGVWPADAAEPPPTAPTLFDREPEAVMAAASTVAPGHHPPVAERRPAAAPTALTLGLWEAEGGTETVATPPPDPAAELEAGREALVAGAIDDAVLHFLLALRLAPALAPAVLEATDGARGAALTMVRGDAYRLAGHEAEAQQAYVIAAHGGLPERRREPRGDTGPVAPGDAPAGPQAETHEPAAAGADGTTAASDPIDAPQDAASPDQDAAADELPGPDDAEPGTEGGALETVVETSDALEDAAPEPVTAAPGVEVSATRVVASSGRSGSKSSGKAGSTTTAGADEAQPTGEPAAVASVKTTSDGAAEDASAG
jgi:tetratricopeptide (TPR) repeat protein